jgi:hypothetical protein
MPLLRTKHPRQNERNAIGSLGHGGGGAGQNPVAPVAGSAEEGGEDDLGLTGNWFVGLVGGGGCRRGGLGGAQRRWPRELVLPRRSGAAWTTRVPGVSSGC